MYHEKKQYKMYIANCLQSVSYNTANQEKVRIIDKSYAEIYRDWERDIKPDIRTAEEIVRDVIKKAGLKLVK